MPMDDWMKAEVAEICNLLVEAMSHLDNDPIEAIDTVIDALRRIRKIMVEDKAFKAGFQKSAEHVDDWPSNPIAEDEGEQRAMAPKDEPDDDDKIGRQFG